MIQFLYEKLQYRYFKRSKAYISQGADTKSTNRCYLIKIPY